MPGVDKGSREEVPYAETVFYLSGWFFGIVFWIELCMRLVASYCKFFRDAWSYMDMAIVFGWTFSSLGVTLPINPQMLRLIRLLRLLRLVKVVRHQQGLDALCIITTAMKGSLGALLWASVVLLFALMTCALVVNAVLRELYFDEMVATGARSQDLYRYFGTFTRSLYTMFEITLGNWPPVGRLLAEEVHEIFMLFSVIHKLVVGFAMVGVINGIFMQETFKVVATDDNIMVRQKQMQSVKFREKMRRLFRLSNRSGDGKLSLAEFKEVLTYDEVKFWLASMEFDTGDAELVFKLLAGESGCVTEQELTDGVAHMRGSGRSIDVVRLLHAASRLELTMQSVLSLLGGGMVQD